MFPASIFKIMLEKLKNSPILLLCFIIILGVFLRVYKLTQVGFLHSDSVTFIHSLRVVYESFSRHGLFSTEFLQVLIRPPDGAYAVYGKISHVIFHFLFYSIFKNALSNFLYLNVFWSTLTIALTFHIGKTFFNEKTGLLAALFMAVSAFEIQYARSFLSHAGATFFVLLSVYFYLKRLSTPKIYLYLFLSSISLGVAITFHGTTIYFLPALIFLELFQTSFRKNLFREGVSFTSRIFCLGAITGAPIFFFEAIGITFAKQSFIYNFLLVKARHGHYPSDLSPIYVLQQYILSHGIIFFILSLVSIYFMLLKFYKTRDLSYLFLIFFPLFFFSYWTFSTASLNNYFRYLTPIFPCISLCIAILLTNLNYSRIKLQRYAISTIVIISVVINLSMTSAFVKQSLNWNTQMIQTLKEKHVKDLYLTSAFFKSYIEILHPQYTSQTKITQIATPLDLTNIKQRNGSYLLIDGSTFYREKWDDSIRSKVIAHASKQYVSPFLSLYPLLFQITHDGSDPNLIEMALKEDWFKKTYLVDLTKFIE